MACPRQRLGCLARRTQSFPTPRGPYKSLGTARRSCPTAFHLARRRLDNDRASAAADVRTARRGTAMTDPIPGTEVTDERVGALYRPLGTYAALTGTFIAGFGAVLAVAEARKRLDREVGRHGHRPDRDREPQAQPPRLEGRGRRVRPRALRRGAGRGGGPDRGAADGSRPAPRRGAAPDLSELRRPVGRRGIRRGARLGAAHDAGRRRRLRGRRRQRLPARRLPGPEGPRLTPAGATAAPRAAGLARYGT